MPPTLEYHLALDMCATATYTSAGRLGVLTHSTFYQRELAPRLCKHPAPVLFADTAAPLHNCTSIIWAEPEQPTAASLLAQMPPRCELWLITANPLARRLPEWHTATPPATAPCGSAMLLRLVRHAGYTTHCYGMHSIASIAYGEVGRLLARLHRHDLADRWAARMRAAYLVQGWQAHLAPVAVLHARPLEHTP